MQGITFGIPQVLRKTLFGMVVYFTGCLWNTVPGMVDLYMTCHLVYMRPLEFVWYSHLMYQRS
jgi:hypothetical protein